MARMDMGRWARLSRAARTALTGVLAAVLSWAILFGTLQAALVIPSLEQLSPLARAGALDYSLGPVGLFESLRASFIAEILGLDLPTSIHVADGSSSDDSVLAAPIDSTSIAPIPGRLPRAVVEHPFDNDDFDDAHPISSIPFTGKTDTRSAQREASEPDDCEPVGGTVWYRYQPDSNIGLLANSFGSDHAVALGVFAGKDLTNLRLVDCDVHPEGNAQVVFPAKRGNSYFLRVTAPASGGDLVFSLDPLGTTSMVSVARNGKESASGESKYAAVSADGRYVSFHSSGEDLVWRREKKNCYWQKRSTSDCPDVYVRDMATGRNELVSRNTRGVSSNGVSGRSAISGDGRFVLFWSVGNNLVPADDNDAGDYFVHDRLTKETERVSLSSDGEEGTIPWVGNHMCKGQIPRTIPPFDQGWPEICKSQTADFLGSGSGISSDGRHAVFASTLHGLVDPEPPHCTDVTQTDRGGANHGPGIPIPVDLGALNCRQIYVRDRKTDETRLVSLSSDGKAGNGDSAGPFISRNGRWVAFSSSATNLVENDTNQFRDVFIHDLRTGATELASTSTWGFQGDAQSGGTSQRGHATISNNGRWVAFVSHASNLTQDDGNYSDDVFLKDRRTGETILVTGATGSPSSPLDYGSSGHSSISTDGRYIGFTSDLGDGSQVRQELFVYDRVTRTITRISVATSGEECDGKFSHEPEISADGHFVVFESDCSNFDRRYRDSAQSATDFDVFIHELPWVR